SKDRKIWLQSLAGHRATVVFFEAPHRILRTLKDVAETVGDVEVAVGRELTKVHEQLVRGPISRVTGAIGHPKGEFCVVIYIGQMTAVSVTTTLSAKQAGIEYGELTNNDGFTRRQAIGRLATKYRLSARQVF